MTEDAEQMALFRWLDVTRWQGQPLTDWYWHIPNGGSRHMLEALKLKRMGVKAGVPDVFGAIPTPEYHGHFLELKARGGRVRPEQRAMHERLRERRYRVDVCYGWDEARIAVEHYLAPHGRMTVRG